jgi:hypothetical protein
MRAVALLTVSGDKNVHCVEPIMAGTCSCDRTSVAEPFHVNFQVYILNNAYRVHVYELLV